MSVEQALGGHVRAGGLDLWVERQGTGPDVLLIAGLGDPAEGDKWGHHAADGGKVVWCELAFPG